jgi:hypothetical protein
MKITVMAASVLFLAFSAQAQTHVAGGGGAAGQMNFAGGGGGGFGIGGSGLGGATFALPVIDRNHEHYTYAYAKGSDQTFEPTRFVSYEAALKMGKEALAYHPKSIVEVAAECRAAEKQLKASHGEND